MHNLLCCHSEKEVDQGMTPPVGMMPGSAASDDSDYDSDRGFEIRPSDKTFLCGVVEGFYGRPWNTNQRLELFRRMKQFGMNTYLYAPKDDVKHRAYWRDLYTVEEAESLTELIQQANKHDIVFVYAISPGLDITYSSNKDLTILRRKLDQVSSFGCKSFALLFDDIVPEMNKSDKEVFPSFAHAQSSVTNQMYEHLKQPAFMFCPTEYCATRAVPTVLNSQYLNTLGEKLIKGIEIMWTGPKVVSKTISLSSIKELTRVLRRPPLIWDNIHANDYDQKRIYLGPFAGRSPSLIPYLAGVLTNPNCEFEPNYVALHTLAAWSKCKAQEETVDTPETNVEREGLSKLEDSSLILAGYDARLAHRVALAAWLPTFYIQTQPDGGRPPPPKLALAPTEDTPIVEAVNAPILNNIPTSVMTCMAVTPTTQTAPVGLVVPVEQLVGEVVIPPEAAAALCASLADSKESFPSAVSGNLVGEPMEVITDKPAIACESPVVKDMLPNSLVNTVPAAGAAQTLEEDSMQVDDDMTSCVHKLEEKQKLTIDELEVICDMFYLPFEHGPKALHLLTEFQWLQTNSHAMHQSNNPETVKTRIDEWEERAAGFNQFVLDFKTICEKFAMIPNRCLLYDMNDYLWDLRGTISVLNSYIKWLGTAKVMTEPDCDILDYRVTWSTKGYNKAFLSGDNEPWVFRGGLTGELQRLLPLECATDLFTYSARPVAGDVMTQVFTIRPYNSSDEMAVYRVCNEANKHLCVESEINEHPQLIPNLLVGGFLTISSQFCFVVEDDKGICGYVLAAPDASDFHSKMASSWLPAMHEKYQLPAPLEGTTLTRAQDLMGRFHSYAPESSESIITHHPGLLTMDFSPHVEDFTIKQRALACLFAALKSTKVKGVHCMVENASTHHGALYCRLGFVMTDSGSLTSVRDDVSVLVRSI